MEQNTSSSSTGLPAALRDQLHECENVCERLEKLAAGSTPVDDYAGAVKSLCDEFETKCTLPPEYAEILRRRFDEARQAAKIGEEAAANAKREAASRLDECAALSKELDQLIAAGELVTLGEVRKLESRWNDRISGVDPIQADAAGFESRLAPLRARLEAEEAAEQLKSDKIADLTAKLEALLVVEDVNAAQESKKAIEAEFAVIDLPPKHAVDAYRASLHKVASKIGQFYETLDLARWESFTLKGDLCAELEKLGAAPETDLPAAAKRLRELRDKWKTLGSVPRSRNEEINARYLEASRKLQHRIDEFYADARQKHREAGAAKKELCEQAAAIAESTDWGNTANAFKALQAKWKELPGAGAAEKELFTAFRAAADKFFNARKAHFDERNAKFDAISKRKEELIAVAETLTSLPNEAAIRKAKLLRSDFSAAGFAGRADNDLSNRFNAALDKIFAARREEFAGRENKARELVAELIKLTENLTDPQTAETRARAIRSELGELACRNTRRQEDEALAAFGVALEDAKAKINSERSSLFRPTAEKVSALLAKVVSGEKIEEAEFAIDGLNAFHKLAASVELMRAVASGDAKAMDKLKRAAVSAASEMKRICGELEKSLGVAVKPADNDPMALAAELQAAMMCGNFGGAKKEKAEAADPAKLAADFMNCGAVMPDELTALLKRFEDLSARVKI